MHRVSTPHGGFNNNRWCPRNSRPRLNFPRIAEVALNRAECLVPAWLPHGKRHGHEWVALNPTRADAHAGSFSVNLRTGRWADFATGDKGGDLISLRAYLDGTGQLAGARKLQEGLGHE
jgi:putative DNA primase/helicase